MTTLGQAYVQIMPSAKGISGSIQKAVNPEATAAGKSAGSRIASSIANSMGKAGKTLTKAITVPALGAATAVGGIVAAFGWGRLTGLDSARAQLQGLGYDAKSVERISSQVKDAIQGTVTTMAEGVSVAAGGLAAGVKEGKDLEKYIQLVGDAAVGAKRPVADMAQIFNRVQGSGKLMTMELNMIEQGMPGFAMAMAKHLKVPQDEFREMVTAGEVSSKDFLNVMDSFAGDMSDAYAKSWQGLVSNTKAWIGIIGENILGGVFEQSKESVAEFMAFLKSDDVQEWAKEMGQAIGDAFVRIIENIKNAIDWWIDLDDDTKKLIKTIAGIAIVLGPVLMFLSKVTSTIMSLMPLFKAIGVVIGVITSPIGLVVAAIAALVAGFVYLWKTNEGFRDFFINMWERIKEVTMNVVGFVVDFVMGIWSSLTEFWEEHGQAFIDSVMFVWNAIYGFIEPIISEIVGFVMHIWGMLVDFWQDHGQMIMDAVLNVFQTIWNFIEFVWSNVFLVVKNQLLYILDIIKVVMNLIWDVIKAVWPAISTIFVVFLQTIWEQVENVFSMVMEFVKVIWNTIKGIIEGALNVIMGIVQFFSSLFTGNWSGMWDAVKRIFSGALGIISSIVSGAFNGLLTIVTRVVSAIGIAINGVWTAISKSTSKIWDGIVGVIKAAINGVISAINAMLNAISRINIKLPKIPDWVPLLGGKGGNTIGFPKIPNIPKLDVGTDYVSRTGLALIHEGEAVVPAKANRPYSGGGIGENDVTQLLIELIDAVKKGQNISLFPDGGTFARKTGDYTSQEGGNRIRRTERGLA